MIAVDDSQKDREAPAKSVEELVERLSVYIGRTLKVKTSMVATISNNGSAYGSTDVHMAIGELTAIALIRKHDSVLSIQMGVKLGDKPDHIVRLNSEISVLTDGRWVPIHDPKNGN